MKSSFLSAFLGICIVSTATANADSCKPVDQYINLGKKAEKCISKIEAVNTRAGEVLLHNGFCTHVREARDQVQSHIQQLPASTLNSCAEKNLQAYSDAASAIQRLYQIELQMK